MNISKTTPKNFAAQPAKTAAPNPKESPSSAPATQDTMEQSSPWDTVEEYLPYGMVALGAAAGLAGGIAGGDLGTAGRVLAFAGIGGGLGTLNALGADTSGKHANYGLSTAIGATLGAAVGGFALADGGPIVTLAGTLLGGVGAGLTGVTLATEIHKYRTS